MATPFDSVARAALEELVMQHLHTSKRGYILTHDGLDELVEELLKFLKASRNLKGLGDRFISSQGQAPSEGVRR